MAGIDWTKAMDEAGEERRQLREHVAEMTASELGEWQDGVIDKVITEALVSGTMRDKLLAGILVRLTKG